MSWSINRRDFLKLAALAPFGVALPRLARAPGRAGEQTNRQNILIVVFDAWTARNISAYGYARNTTPNIARLAQRAVVFRNHYATGNFTNPGTASLLTGVYPWTHRALRFQDRMNPRFNKHNLFNIFKDYHRFAYTHNPYAFDVIRPLAPEMDELVPIEKLLLQKNATFASTVLRNDEDIANVSWSRETMLEDDGFAYSLYMSHLVTAAQIAARPQAAVNLFPRGLPGYRDGSTFLLESAMGWLASKAMQVPRPFLGYFHMLPPHDPYHTRIEFVDRFKDDGYEPRSKPLDLFANGDGKNELDRRRNYDEFLLYVDEEFGLLFNALESSGILDTTWLVLTSDHGESFERGLVAHGTRALYEPQVRIPLMIFEPGRQVGEEIQTRTSAVDVVPTLAHLTGHAIPGWVEGTLLPPYAPEPGDPERSVYGLMAAENDPNAPIHTGTAIILKDNYKLQYFFGYEKPAVTELVQLFDIQADPEEMVDLSSSHPDISAALLAELKGKMTEADQPYHK